MLEKELQFFNQNRDKFVKEHRGEYVLIKDENVIGFFPDRQQAIKTAAGQFELGTFLIHQCIDENNDVHRFHSRVAFK